MQPTKHFAKKVCIFNLLQQISIVLPKFIHILSTKLAKCAIYKTNFFAFAEYPHTNAHVHYIKTNNKLYLYSCRSVLLWYSVGYIPAKTPPLQRYDLSLPCSCVLCCVSYAVADMWMMIYVLSLPVCLLRVRVPLCVDIV